jgi:hypothetical protein
MERVWKRPALVLSGLLLTAVCAMPQAYTISAKPGAINYIEGNAFLNDKPISEKNLKSKFLGANDTLSTDMGKAEVLLTPGVFLRLGDNSQIRMVSPSLTDTQVEVNRGEAMLEVTGLMKDNNILILDHGSITTIEKDGLYRFTADNPPTAAVLDGKAIVTVGNHKIDLKKDKETVLAEDLKAEKLDLNKTDDLYAWSNVRSEYEAAASYRVSQTAYSSSGSGGWRGFGYNGFYGPGWYWDNGFSSWAWLPGMGAFYSPFGYGFYSPGLVAYAPVVLVPVRPSPVVPVKGATGPGHPVQPVMTAAMKGIVTNVPVNPRSPAAVGMFTASPAANQAARMQAAHTIASSGGFRTASGASAPAMVGHGVSAAPANAGGGSHGGGGNAGGGFHGASAPASMGGGGAHGGGGGHK